MTVIEMVLINNVFGVIKSPGLGIKMKNVMVYFQRWLYIFWSPKKMESIAICWLPKKLTVTLNWLNVILTLTPSII